MTGEGRGGGGELPSSPGDETSNQPGPASGMRKQIAVKCSQNKEANVIGMWQTRERLAGGEFKVREALHQCQGL